MRVVRNSEQKVEILKTCSNAILPKYNHDNDACMDLFTPLDVYLAAGETTIIPLNISIGIPKGFEARIRGRSGLSSKGIQVHHGTIDEGYTGILGVIITNTNPVGFSIETGKAIAQLTISPVYRIILKEVEQLSATERGNKGFGSSDA